MYTVQPSGENLSTDTTVNGRGHVVSQHIDAFIVARSYAPSSAAQRRHLLTKFCDHTNGDLSVASVYSWWASIAHLADATRRAHLSAVRQFVAHLIVVGVLDTDPTATIQPPRIHHAPPVTITPTEAIRFLACITNLRDRCAAALMLGAGLRAGDVARLDVDHIDLAQRIVRVPGKGGKVRLVPIPEVVADIVRHHIEPLDHGPLIRTQCGHRLSAEQLRYRLTRELYRAGIKHGPHDGRSSHVLRRTCATTLLESGAATIVDVQAILGHAELSSTQRYMALPDAKRLLSVIESGPLSAA
jgi:site-specific recombinase XerC